MSRRPKDIDPDLEELWDEAYDKGHEDGWEQANNRVADLLNCQAGSAIDKTWLLNALWR
jgi:hypothetical protein